MTAVADDDEMTELLDADFPRVDLVGKGANGIPRFLIAKQDEDSRGIVPPDLVRELIGKQADPEPDDGGPVTMTGSPAAIAKLMAEGALRFAKPVDDVAKAKLSSAELNDLPDSAFAYVEAGGKKDSEGKTTPRSLRHFAIHDKAHADNAAARIAQGAKFGDKAKGKVEAAQRKFGEKVSKEAGMPDAVTKADLGPELDGGVDGMDPTVALAEPDEMGPGDMTDPGSPAWESIDAATAQKWTSIAVRLKNALCVLAEREMLEAASVDPSDAENAFDLQDAMCAVDYVIDTLAGFAVDEQAEADLGGEAMEAVGKSADDGALTAIRKAMDGADLTAAALSQLETFAVIAKSGRVLSSVNEAHIREAAGRLNTVLASLPQAPTTDDGQPVAKQEGQAMAETETQDSQVEKADADEQARNSGPVTDTQVPGMGAIPGMPQNQTMSTPSGRTVLKAAVFDQSRALLGLVDPARITQVAKADDGDGKVTMQAVFDENGNLVGIVDPADITPVAGAGGKSDDAPAADAAPAADDGDMTPQPPADAGTPADAPADDNVTKQVPITQDVLKSIAADAARTALEAQGAAHAEVVAKMAADNAGLAEELEVVKARLETVENTPAAPKVFTNGQTPPAHQLRGQDQGAPPAVDVAKAADLKRTLYTGTAQEQNKAFGELQAAAIDGLAALHATRRPA